jgi:hypothetical protein
LRVDVGWRRKVKLVCATKVDRASAIKMKVARRRRRKEDVGYRHSRHLPRGVS